jgi:hypothetical protein
MDLPPIMLPQPASAPPTQLVAPATPVTPSRFAHVLERMGRELDRGEALVNEVVRGRAAGLDAAALIALQVGIYRYSEVVDLAAKFVDRAGSAVRTTLQGSGG